VSAATRDDELVDFCFGENEAVKSVDNGESGKESDVVEEIVGTGAIFLGEG